MSCVAAAGLRGQQSVEGHLTNPLEKEGHQSAGEDSV